MNRPYQVKKKVYQQATATPPSVKLKMQTINLAKKQTESAFINSRAFCR